MSLTTEAKSRTRPGRMNWSSDEWLVQMGEQEDREMREPHRRRSMSLSNKVSHERCRNSAVIQTDTGHLTWADEVRMLRKHNRY